MPKIRKMHHGCLGIDPAKDIRCPECNAYFTLKNLDLAYADGSIYNPQINCPFCEAVEKANEVAIQK